ncbi:class I SAM-dependent methyltransferase [Streptomyces hirsutus]|uniref:class I SAM-dependent methyltransferase n=1 Tax=Streptomyces hirsutus TaxID=35620 RepID=UPI0033C08C6D
MNPATGAVPSGLPPDGRSAPYDAFYTARARTDLVTRLYAAAMGENYPSEVAAFSSCDWPLLGLMTARLRLRPGQMLVDAGCGTGGIGLWLARALSLRLAGFDLSPVAVVQAAARRSHFGLPAARTAFRVAELENTGLPDAAADGIVCVDAFGHATDRIAALRELGRLLAPGGRLLLTRALRSGAMPSWREQAQAAGLVVEDVDERPAEPAMWQRLYRLWIAHAAELHRELGQAQARHMLEEAQRVLPMLPDRRAVLLTLRRPGASPKAPETVDTMAQPGSRLGREPMPSKRRPQ